MPLVDRIYRVETKAWKKRPLSLETLREIRSLRAVLRGERFDLCVDLQGSIRSAVIGRMSAALEFVGSADPREREARLLYGRKVDARGQHVVEQWCEVLGGAVGDKLVPERVELPVDDFAEEQCENLLRRFGLEGERLIMIAPTAGWGAKQWLAERFGQVAAELGRHGWKVVVNSADADDPVAQEVVRVSEGNATVLAGDLSTLIALTRRAELVIGGDTGPLHLAAALERSVVGIYGPTDPARNGPWGTRAVVLRHGPERRDHRRRAEPEEGLLMVSVEEVVAAALGLLSGKQVR
jgi:heptosyltransferase-1